MHRSTLFTFRPLASWTGLLQAVHTPALESRLWLSGWLPAGNRSGILVASADAGLVAYPEHTAGDEVKNIHTGRSRTPVLQPADPPCFSADFRAVSAAIHCCLLSAHCLGWRESNLTITSIDFWMLVQAEITIFFFCGRPTNSRNRGPPSISFLFKEHDSRTYGDILFHLVCVVLRFVVCYFISLIYVCLPSNIAYIANLWLCICE